MMGGIDQQVAQQANQFRQNPQGLQQRYAQGHSLIDLLALQKLKTDKEKAARELQLGQQIPQQTIAQQREQEVMALTKNEVAQGLGPGIQQMGQRMQQAMQQNPQAGGIASVPRPPMRMAAGGLVRFTDGGEVKPPVKLTYADELAKAMEEQLAAAEQEEKLTPEQREKLRAISIARQERDPVLRGIEMARAESKGKPVPFAVGSSIRNIGREVGSDSADVVSSELGALARGIAGVANPFWAGLTGNTGSGAAATTTPAPAQAPAPPEETPDEEVPTGVASVAAAQQPDGSINSGSGAQLSEMAKDPNRELLMKWAMEKMQQDPMEAAKLLQELYRTSTRGVRDNLARQMKEQEEMRAEIGRQQDPKRMAWDNLKATMLGMGKGYSTADALRGANAGGMNEQARQNAMKLQGIAALNQMTKEQGEIEQTLGEGLYGAGSTGYTTAANEISSAASVAANMSNHELMAEIGRLDAAVRAEGNRLAERGLDEAKIFAELRDASIQLQNLELKRNEAIDKNINIMMYRNDREKAIKDGKKDEAYAAEDNIARLTAEIDKQLDPVRQSVIVDLNALRSRLGMSPFSAPESTKPPSAEGLSDKARAIVESQGK